MKRIGVFIGEEEKSMFFEEILKDLSIHHQIELFEKKTYAIPLLYGRLNRWTFQQGIRSMLRRNDLCFFEWASELLMHGSQLPKQCPIVTRLHSFELYEWAPKINWDHVDRVILVSQAMEKKYVNLYPNHAHKTVVVYNGISLEKFKPPPKPSWNLNLGMLCAITPIKRIYEVILMLYDLVKQQGYNAHLHLAGEPRDDLRYSVAVYQLAEELGLHNAVTFHGYVNDVPGWLQKIDILISNSYWEGHPVNLIEAMATGCYCLSHAWDGAREVLPPENLYITEAELLQKIVEYCEQPEAEKQKRQRQMRAIAFEKFDIDRTKRQIRAIVDSVSESGGQ
jgi:glycosyltransferase involved in cell wall biosynthesis